jgi:hypothetical protein
MTQVGELTVAVAEVGVNAATPGHVGGVVGIGQGKAFQDSELRFDRVEPGGFRGRPDRDSVQSSQQGEEPGVIVDVVQVVQNHEQSLARITSAEVAEGFADAQDPFVPTKQATEAIGLHAGTR